MRILAGLVSDEQDDSLRDSDLEDDMRILNQNSLPVLQRTSQQHPSVIETGGTTKKFNLGALIEEEKDGEESFELPQPNLPNLRQKTLTLNRQVTEKLDQNFNLDFQNSQLDCMKIPNLDKQMSSI